MESLFSDSSSILYAAFFQILFHIPLIGVYIVGIVISFTKSEKYHRISLLSGIAFGILIVLSVLSSLISMLVPYLYSRRYDTQSIGMITSIIGFIMILINSGATVLLIIAIWKDRQ